MRILKRPLVIGLGSLALVAMLAATFVLFMRPAHAAEPTDISVQQVMSVAKSHHIGGVIVAGTSNNGGDHHPSETVPFVGAPPLMFNGSPAGTNCFFAPCFNGNVMMTASTGPLTVVPIFWTPSGYPMADAYKNLITTYLGDVAHDSGKKHNVFAVANEYYGNNGQIQYDMRLGPVLTDTHTIVSDCTVGANDATGIYPDGSGYSACVSDATLTAEVDAVTQANGLPHDLSHIYVMFFPKHVETCFFPGSTTTSANACTINYQPSAAYCAYHSQATSGTVYANMPFPVYHSGTHYTCGSEARGHKVIETPNGNPDADTEISPTSHEIMEAATDPDTQTGWYDANGFENGDECAYTYGPWQGTPGQLYNQVINGRHYLTQEEFSNIDFAKTGGGCVQSE